MVAMALEHMHASTCMDTKGQDKQRLADESEKRPPSLVDLLSHLCLL